MDAMGRAGAPACVLARAHSRKGHPLQQQRWGQPLAASVGSLDSATMHPSGRHHAMCCAGAKSHRMGELILTSGGGEGGPVEVPPPPKRSKGSKAKRRGMGGTWGGRGAQERRQMEQLERSWNARVRGSDVAIDKFVAVDRVYAGADGRSFSAAAAPSRRPKGGAGLLAALGGCRPLDRPPLAPYGTSNGTYGAVAVVRKAKGS